MPQTTIRLPLSALSSMRLAARGMRLAVGDYRMMTSLSEAVAPDASSRQT